MTTYTWIKEEGRQEGIQEGRQEGLKEGKLESQTEIIMALYDDKNRYNPLLNTQNFQ